MYDSKLFCEETEALFDAVLSLKDKEDCYRFFEDICTIKEVRDIAQRLHVAKLLSNGETVAAIAQKTGASTTTVSRVNRSLNYGAGGYKLVIAQKNEK